MELVLSGIEVEVRVTEIGTESKRASKCVIEREGEGVKTKIQQGPARRQGGKG